MSYVAFEKALLEINDGVCGLSLQKKGQAKCLSLMT